MPPALQDELKKRGPFDSIEQEATLAILRTSDLLENRFGRLLREHGLTPSQYNVLRILRGEGKPIPSLEVAERMIQVAPAITRVADQLVRAGLVVKSQSEADRRVHHLELTTLARKTLKRLDAPILELHARLLAGVSKTDLRKLIKTLEQARAAVSSETPAS